MEHLNGNKQQSDIVRPRFVETVTQEDNSLIAECEIGGLFCRLWSAIKRFFGA